MADRKLHLAVSGIVVLVGLLAAPFLHAEEKGKDDFDIYKLRVDAGWYYSDPTGSIHGSNDSGSIDLNKDLGFNSYPTFSGKVDWKFTRKIIFTLRSFHSIPHARRYLTEQLRFRGRRSMLD
jgi:hypothetical protein